MKVLKLVVRWTMRGMFAVLVCLTTFCILAAAYTGIRDHGIIIIFKILGAMLALVLGLALTGILYEWAKKDG